MRPVPVPEWVKASLPWARRQVVAAPDGDLTNPNIAPVEALVDDRSLPGCRVWRVYARPEGQDLPALIEGGVAEFVMWAPRLPVHGFAVWHRPVEERRYLEVGGSPGSPTRLVDAANVVISALRASMPVIESAGVDVNELLGLVGCEWRVERKAAGDGD